MAKKKSQLDEAIADAEQDLRIADAVLTRLIEKKAQLTLKKAGGKKTTLREVPHQAS